MPDAEKNERSHRTARTVAVLSAAFLLVSLVHVVSCGSKERIIVVGNIFVPAGERAKYEFTNDRDCHLRLYFDAEGGAKDDVRVRVMEASAYVKYRNGQSAKMLYDSKQRTAGDDVISVPRGSYVIEFDNSFSIFSDKSVDVNVALGP